MNKAIYQMLIDLGCRPDLAGFQMLIDAVLIAIEHNGAIRGKSIYQVLSEQLTVSPSSVERNIRYVIQQAIKLKTPAFQSLFGLGNGNPRVYEFVAVVAVHMSYNELLKVPSTEVTIEAV